MLCPQRPALEAWHSHLDLAGKCHCLRHCSCLVLSVCYASLFTHVILTAAPPHSWAGSGGLEMFMN